MGGFERLSGDKPIPDRFEESTFRCHHCRDTGYVLGTVTNRWGTYDVAQKCQGGDCPEWRNHRSKVEFEKDRRTRDTADYARIKRMEESGDDD